MRIMPRKEPAELRFWRKVEKFDGGCWNWAAYRDKTGYGRFAAVSGRLVLAHRFAYETTVGPIPHGLELDHLCRNPSCVNPSHLEPVTRRENVVRGVSPNAVNAAKTHCIRGHELSRENCYTTKWPYNRECKACAQQASRDKTAMRRAERNAIALRKAIEGLS